jgi:hypothetical protein
MTAHFIVDSAGPQLKYAIYICIMQKHAYSVFAAGDCMEFINIIITYLVHTRLSCISSVDSVTVFS